MLSTTKSAPWVSECRIMNQPKATLASVSTPSESRPRLPSFSRKPMASAGSPGAAFGKINVTRKAYKAYRPASTKPGMKAPSYMSPTDLPSWSAITIRTSEGGMICASVPEAAMMPVAIRRS